MYRYIGFEDMKRGMPFFILLSKPAMPYLSTSTVSFYSVLYYYFFYVLQISSFFSSQVFTVSFTQLILNLSPHFYGIKFLISEIRQVQGMVKERCRARLHEYRGTLNPVHAKHRQNSGICSHCALQREGFFGR